MHVQYNEQPKNEVKKTVTFTIALTRIKYIEINSSKEIKDLYNENYKTVPKENKLNIKSVNTSFVLGLESFMLVRCQYYPKFSIDST